MYDYDRRDLLAAHAGLPLVQRLAAKYARLLGVGELPTIKIVNNLRSTWLGRLTFRAGQQNLMEVQARALVDEATAERIVAHEMCHHVEFLRLTEGDLAALRLGIRPASHGSAWRELAAKVNAVMGADFVSEKSDQSYVQAEVSRPYFLLITNTIGTNLGYAIAVRLSPRMKSYLSRALGQGSRLFRTTDPRWSNGPTIGAGWIVPKDPANRAELDRIYASTDTVAV